MSLRTATEACQQPNNGRKRVGIFRFTVAPAFQYAAQAAPVLWSAWCCRRSTLRLPKSGWSFLDAFLRVWCTSGTEDVAKFTRKGTQRYHPHDEAKPVGRKSSRL